MDYFNQILNFTQGNRAPDEWESLFFELSKDGQLRADFQNHLVIESTIKDYSSKYDPPLDSALNIIRATGLSKYSSKPAQGIMSKIQNISPIVSGVLSSVVTFIIIFSLYGQEILGYHSNSVSADNKIISKSNNTRELIQTKNNSTSKSTIKPASTANRIPIKNSHKNMSQSSNNSTSQGNQISTCSKTSENTKLADKYLDHKYSALSQVSDLALNFDSKIKLSLSESSSLPKQNSIDTFLDKDNFINTPYENTDFSLQVFTSAVKHLPDPNIGPDEYINFTNMGFNLNYLIDDNWKIGIDLRQETFFQEFENDKEFIWQQPNLTSLSGLGRYTFKDLDMIQPYGQLSLGFSRAGAISRFQLGTEYSLYPDLKLLMGLEYSLLYYYHKQSNFLSEKLNLNLGLEFNL